MDPGGGRGRGVVRELLKLARRGVKEEKLAVIIFQQGKKSALREAGGEGHGHGEKKRKGRNASKHKEKTSRWKVFEEN